MTERFELLEQIGKGGMGVVWKARDLESGEIIALKRLHEIFADDEDYVARVEREVEIARRIESPYVVKVLGYGRDAGVPYIAMEYVEGQSLRQLLSERGKVSWPEAKQILLQTAQGLAAVHESGAVHRDVKPSNILVTADGGVKLADFGIAKASDLTGITGSATMLGTPMYMAPDVKTTAQSDLYALGCVLYEMLSGVPPFAGDSQSEVVVRHVREAPDLSRVPSDARSITAWLLAKEPTRRAPSAADLVAVLSGSSKITGNVAGAPRRRAWVAAMIAFPALVGVGGLGVAAIVLMGSGRHNDSTVAAGPSVTRVATTTFSGGGGASPTSTSTPDSGGGTVAAGASPSPTSSSPGLAGIAQQEAPVSPSPTPTATATATPTATAVVSPPVVAGMQQVPGQASDIAVGADGSVWITTKTPEPDGGTYTIAKWTGNGWATVPGNAVRIAVARDGTPWVVNTNGYVFALRGGSWQLMPGLATDIGAGADGSIWVTTTTPESDGGKYTIARWYGSNWQSIDGHALRIAVGSDGNPWVVNEGGFIYHHVGTWSPPASAPGPMRDIAVGPQDQIYAVGTNDVVYRVIGPNFVPVLSGYATVAQGLRETFGRSTRRETFGTVRLNSRTPSPARGRMLDFLR